MGFRVRVRIHRSELSPVGTPEVSPGRQSWEHVQQFGESRRDGWKRIQPSLRD
jgi:hypothetical protein